MSTMKKAVEYFRFFGPRGMNALLKERLVSDPRRYGAGLTGEVPTFPPLAYQNEPLSPCAPGSMSILYLIHCFYPEHSGGTERFVLNLAREQLQRGHKTRVFALYTGILQDGVPFGDGGCYKDYEYMGVPVTIFAYRHAPHGLRYLRVAESDSVIEQFFAFLLEREHFDVVHAAYPQTFAPVLRMCRERKIPYVVTLTDFTLICPAATMIRLGGVMCPGSSHGKACAGCAPDFGVGSFETRYENAARLLMGARYITAPSDYAARVIQSQFPGISLRVVPHGIAESFSARNVQRTQTCRFVYAGNLSAIKGIEPLLTAFSRLEGKHLTLTVCGGGRPDRLRALRRMADSRVRFAGTVDAASMPQMFFNSDCVVVPSVWGETYSFTLREALRSGCIAVVSDVGTLPEAISPGKNGFLCVPGNVESLLAALQKARDFDWKTDSHVETMSIPMEADEYERMYCSCCR